MCPMCELLTSSHLEHVGSEDKPWSQMTWVQIPALPLTGCVTVGNSHNLSVLQFSLPVKEVYNSIYLLRLC